MSNRRKPNNTKPDVASILAAARRAEKTVELCLRGDLVAEVEDLERQLRDASAPTDRLIGNAEGRKIARQIEDLQREMRDHTIVLRLRALSRREFQQFVAEHPPRKGNEEDERAGVNVETYFDDLIKVCTVEPELTDEQWETLFDAVNTRQWNDLRSAAIDLNTDRVSVPFSAAASLLIRFSGEK